VSINYTKIPAGENRHELKHLAPLTFATTGAWRNFADENSRVYQTPVQSPRRPRLAQGESFRSRCGWSASELWSLKKEKFHRPPFRATETGDSGRHDGGKWI